MAFNYASVTITRKDGCATITFNQPLLKHDKNNAPPKPGAGKSAFNPAAIARVRLHATEYVLRTRKQYTVALRHNLKCLLDGNITPRGFVDEFFVLTEAGNMRHDIRRKLVLSLLLSETIRPSIKFLILENFDRMPDAVRGTIAANVLRAKPTRHTVLIQEELKWIVAQEKNGLPVH